MNPEILEELDINFKELGFLLQNLDQKVQNLESKAGQLAAGYLIFEIVFSTQVLQYHSAALQERRWIPLCFFASAALVFWLTFIKIVGDCLRIKRQQDLVFMEQENLYRKMFSIRNGRRQDDSDQDRFAKPLAKVQNRRYVFVGTVFCCLFCVTVVVLYALVTIQQPRP